MPAYSRHLTLLVAAISVLPIAARAASIQLSNDSLSVSEDYRISPDGTFAVFNSDKGLYSVPIGGGANQKLNEAQFSVTQFVISPNSSRVVFLDNQIASNSDELFSVPIVGGTTVRLNIPLTNSADIRTEEFRITPNSQNVVFKALKSPNQIALYSSPIDGGGALEISSPLSSEFTVDNSRPNEPFQITPDSTTVVYLESPNITPSNLPYKLWSVPVVGGTAVQLSQQLPAGHGISSNTYRLTPDGESVVYHVFITNTRSELYSASIAGGQNTLLTASDNTGEVLSSRFYFTPDGTRLMYRGRDELPTLNELFSTKLSGDTPLRLNDRNLDARDVGSFFELTADGQTAVYTASADVSSAGRRIYSVPIGGGLTNILTPEIGVSDFALTTDGTHVVFTSSFADAQKRELYTIPVAGGEIKKLNSPLFQFGDVLDYVIAPDGKSIVYVATPNSLSIAELFQVNIASGSVAKLNDLLPAGSTVDRFTSSHLEITPDGLFVTYRVLDSLGRAKLYAASLIPEPYTGTLIVIATAATFLVRSRTQR